LGQVSIRAYGDKRDLEDFLRDIKKLYGICVSSPILKNTRPTDEYPFRVIITIDIRGTER